MYARTEKDQPKSHVITDRREMLRVKLKSLAEEARIIRHEAQRTYGQLRYELNCHRTGTVRYHARHSHIAYGLIKGRTLAQIEGHALTPPDWKEVRRLLDKYGPYGAGKLVVQYADMPRDTKPVAQAA